MDIMCLQMNQSQMRQCCTVLNFTACELASCSLPPTLPPGTLDARVRCYQHPPCVQLRHGRMISARGRSRASQSSTGYEALPKRTLTSLRGVFEAFDHDHDGLLKVEEVGTILDLFGVNMVDSAVLALVTEMEPVQRKLSFDAFAALACRAMPGEDVAEEVTRAFSAFTEQKDSDGRLSARTAGAIDASSLQKAMQELGLPVSNLMSQDMINEADLDHDGKVNLKDWCGTMIS